MKHFIWRLKFAILLRERACTPFKDAWYCSSQWENWEEMEPEEAVQCEVDAMSESM